jgi:hypothetical protein
MFTLKRFACIPALLAAVGLTAVVPSEARAQGGVNLVPWVGAYIPTKNEFSDIDNAVFNRDVSVMGGARLTFWGTGNFGFEATGGYAPAKISGETINETNTNVLVASGRVLFALSPATNPVSFYIGAGPALVTRGKDPFDNDASSTKFGGNAGVGFRFALSESGNTALRLDVEDYLYSGDFGGGDSEFQNDIVTSIGLSISLGGSAGD